MNTVISRAFAKIASPSPTLSAQKWQHYASLFLQSYTYATTATSKTPRQSKRRGGAESSSSKSKSELMAEFEAAAAAAAVKAKAAAKAEAASSEWARPSEIPFQAKIANSVNVIGYVHVPVQFEASPDGKCWAGTVLAQTHQISSPPSSPDSPSLRIPIIFEGDLAHIAACHLKEKNFVHVTGRLSADPPHLNANQGQANIQVMVHSLNFVQPSFQMKNSSTSSEQKWSLKRLATVKNEDDISQSWKLVSQSNLRDIRLKEDNPKVAAFEQEEDDDNDGFEAVKVFLRDIRNLQWRELLDDPKQWIDYRDSNRSGSLKPESPDFRHKDRWYPLWLTDAPSWVLSELDRVGFDGMFQKPKEVKQHTGFEAVKFSLRDFSKWIELFDDPKQWLDNHDSKRSGSLKPESPDFTHKDRCYPRWLTDAPSWVSSELDRVEFDLKTQKPKQVKQHRGEESWKDLVQNPTKWRDDRLNKVDQVLNSFRKKNIF